MAGSWQSTAGRHRLVSVTVSSQSPSRGDEPSSDVRPSRVSAPPSAPRNDHPSRRHDLAASQHVTTRHGSSRSHHDGPTRPGQIGRLLPSHPRVESPSPHPPHPQAADSSIIVNAARRAASAAAAAVSRGSAHSWKRNVSRERPAGVGLSAVQRER